MQSLRTFFGRLKNEVFYGYEHEIRNIKNLKKVISSYIYYFNNIRMIRKFGDYQSPVEYRLNYIDKTLLTAVVK
ncbi:IS3 family transposase [[Mycoplasma] testudinis]|uniref:IS3 family transposase n=1 Tax=[Mycoplasma] testudinis TaxID=33924 RepID=UPI0009FF8E69